MTELTQKEVDAISVSVTLTIADWNRVLDWIQDRPMREVSMIHTSIMQQATAAARGAIDKRNEEVAKASRPLDQTESNVVPLAGPGLPVLVDRPRS